MPDHALTPPPTGLQAQRFAGFTPSSYDPEARSVEAVLSVGAAVQRMGYTEELEISEAAVDLGRASTGNVRLLDSHNRGSISANLGTVMDCRVKNGALVGRLHFADTDAGRDAEGMVARGELGAISIGYRVTKWEVVAVDDDTRAETWRATAWELLEASLVTVPADPAAGIRALPHDTERTFPMPRSHQTNPTRGHTQPEKPVDTRADAGRSDRSSDYYFNAQDAMFLVDMARDSGLSEQARGLIDLNERGEISADNARRRLLQDMSERQRAGTSGLLGMNSPPRTNDDQRFVDQHNYPDPPSARNSAVSEALLAKMERRQPNGPAQQFSGMSTVQLAAEVAEEAGVRGVRGMNATQVLDAAAFGRSAPSGGYFGERAGLGGMSTSDFPTLLQDAGNRFLMNRWAEVSSPLKMLGRERSAKDFREISGIDLSGFGTLDPVLEGGELKRDKITARKEGYRVKPFGKIFALTREALVNDDLDAWGDILNRLARAASELEASLIAEIIQSNPVMSDGNPFFSAEHFNLAETGTLPSVDSLDVARAQMRRQKDLDGTTPTNAIPKYLVAGVGRETAIEKLLATQLTPEQVASANPFAGKIVPAIDPRLADAPWYLFADPVNTPAFEFAYLNGQKQPQLATKDGWDILGVEYRVVHDFGAGLMDWRGAYKNPGA